MFGWYILGKMQEYIMSDCCTRKRTWKDVMFLPMAVTLTLIGFALLLGVEMGIAYALGLI